MQGRLVIDEFSDGIPSEMRLHYDGEALARHTFDAELYATSLIGFSSSFRKAHKIVCGVGPKIQIRGEREGGLSSLIQLLIDNQEAAQAINIYAELLQNVVWTAAGVSVMVPRLYLKILDLIKRAGGKREEILKKISDMEIGQNIKSALIQLINDRKFRKGLDDLTLFLCSEGMDYVDIEMVGGEKYRIRKEDRPAFVEQPEDETNVEIDDKIVSVIYPSALRTKWRFLIDGKEYWAEITDINFLREMNDKSLEYFEGIEFSATVETKTIKKVAPGGVSIQRKIYNFSLYTKPEQGRLL